MLLDRVIPSPHDYFPTTSKRRRINGVKAPVIGINDRVGHTFLLLVVGFAQTQASVTK